VGSILTGFVLAALAVSMDVVPAYAKDGHKSMGKHDNGRYEKKGRGHGRGRHEQGRPYGYGERVYVPPPVYYVPPPQPGIDIFLPPIIINP
jgi:hypothetical protein